MKNLNLIRKTNGDGWNARTAKVIGVLYLMFALFSGLVGIAFSAIIYLHLTEWGIEYISDNSLYCLVPVVLEVSKDKLNPWFITGFVDAEGSFQISIVKNKELKTGWRVQSSFQIGLHEKDKSLLELIRSSLGVGQIYKHSKDSFQYEVQTFKELEVIISHFDKYPLRTQKRADFELFKSAIELIKNKEHLTNEGLIKLLAIKGSMNLGFSESLKAAFPNIIPVSRLLVENQTIRDPNWLSGFTSGEGCFFIDIYKSSTSRLREAVKLKFKISQHIRDGLLIKSLVTYLGCGNYYFHAGAGDIVVQKYSDIIPFFNKYPILGVKQKDFLDFKQVVELMKSNAHKTPEGLDKIREIKSGMNRGRSW